MTFLSGNFLWIFVVPLIYLCLQIYGAERRKGHVRFMLGKSAGSGHMMPSILISIALLLSGAAYLRPVSNPRPHSVEQKGKNIVFLVDVSRSMLAEDLIPNRLERARYDISNSIPSLQGHRVGLVAFAGTAVLKCPLTLDYVYFSQAVSELNAHSVSKGGTMLGDALRLVLDELYDSDSRESLDIIIITDGEDQGSYPVESAARAGRDGIRIVALGLGDQSTGAAVPDAAGAPMTYQDEPVYSRADMALLKEMASLSRDGWALEVGKGRLPLESILLKISSKGESRLTGKVRSYSYDEHYRWFLIPSIFLMLWALFLEKGLFSRRGRS